MRGHVNNNDDMRALIAKEIVQLRSVANEDPSLPERLIREVGEADGLESVPVEKLWPLFVAIRQRVHKLMAGQANAGG